jgi:hypothetical protein
MTFCKIQLTATNLRGFGGFHFLKQFRLGGGLADEILIDFHDLQLAISILFQEDVAPGVPFTIDGPKDAVVVICKPPDQLSRIRFQERSVWEKLFEFVASNFS